MTTEPATAAARADAAPRPVIFEARDVTKTFTTPDGHALPVLDGVSFALHEGEIVALLGKSGSGKSTLLRCVAGLILPSSGTVTYRGEVLIGVAVMSVYVVGLNRLVWRRLYHLAETRYAL